jgi:elongation factor P
VATTNDLKNGIVLNIDGQLWTVVEFQHVKPGKGGAFVRTKLKNVLTGKVVDRTFNAGLKVETATVDKREMQYLYKDGEEWVFMDTQSYEQLQVPSAVVGEMSKYLLENQNATVATHEGVPIYIELPASVELMITYTEPGLQGDRSTGGPSRHARDRCRDPGPAVHRVGHEGQGRHPRRVVPRPDQRLTHPPNRPRP